MARISGMSEKSMVSSPIVWRASISASCSGERGLPRSSCSENCFSIKFSFVKNQVLLIRLSLLLPRLRNWRNELRATSGFDYLLCRLALVVKLPVAPRVVIGRVENRPLEELVVHAREALA